ASCLKVRMMNTPTGWPNFMPPSGWRMAIARSEAPPWLRTSKRREARMKDHRLRTTVIGSYPFPGWLEHASQNLGAFGPDDVAEMQDDAVVCAVRDQLA